jgi:hypothetical protein
VAADRHGELFGGGIEAAEFVVMPEPEQQGLFRWVVDAARAYRDGRDPRRLGA